MTTVAVKERPLLMHGVEVRAVLDNRMSLFIRVMKPQPHAGVRHSVFVPSGLEDGHGRERRCPYGVGGRLWVRESWNAVNERGVFWDQLKPNERPGQNIAAVIYKATEDEYEGRYLPSIFMPRWASRITLEVTGVRVALLQSISVEDMRAGGLRPNNEASLLWRETLAENFRALWDELNPKYPWSSNPWVRCVAFKRVVAQKRTIFDAIIIEPIGSTPYKR
jgi:hypothetical protein